MPLLWGMPRELKLLGDEPGGLLFAVAWLRMIQDSLGDPDELVGPPVNLGLSDGFQLLGRGHVGLLGSASDPAAGL